MNIDFEAFNFSEKIHTLPFILCHEFNLVHFDLPLAKKKKDVTNKNFRFIKENLMLVSLLVLSLVIHTF
jgi:hypothetical protein